MKQGFFSRLTRSRPVEATESPPELAPMPVKPEAHAVEKIVRDIVRQGLPAALGKAAISLRLDADVLDWFRAQGAGYQTRINAVLRAYMDAAS